MLNLHGNEDPSSTTVTANIPVVFNSHGCTVNASVHIDLDVVYRSKSAFKTCSEAETKSVQCNKHAPKKRSPGVKAESPADGPFVTPSKVKPARRREPISANQRSEDIVRKPSEFISATAPVRSLTPSPQLGRQGRLSEPLTSSLLVRCAGITRKGTPCKNVQRRLFPSPISDADVDKEFYCHWHVSQAPSPGFTVQKRSGTTKWVTYDDYIPPYLQPATRFELMQLMTKVITEKDEIGWLYCAEIPGMAVSILLHSSNCLAEQSDAEAISDVSQGPLILKIGRSQKPEVRMDQWFSQCGKPLIRRGCFPSKKNRDNTSLNDYIPPSSKGVWSHRLEQLVHLELADLAVNAPYLEPEWERFVKGRDEGKEYQWQTFKTPVAYRATKHGNYDVGKTCKGCGKKHIEIFSFPRIPSGPYKGKEWVIVKDVAEGWARFVRKYM